MPHAPTVLPSALEESDPARRAKLEAAATTLAEVLAARPRFHDAEIHSFTKGMPGRIVARARLRGQDCFVKLLIGPHAGDAIREMRAELECAEANMADDSALRVARVLDAAPRLGLIVLEAAPGERMDNVIETADALRRRELHRRAGDWLAWYCAPRRETRPFEAARFLEAHRHRSRARVWAGELAPQDRQRLAALGDYIKRRARRVRGQPVSIAASHGDFLARNVHVSGKVVTAYVSHPG